MALERLEALAAAHVLDLNCPVSRRQREPGWVVGEGYWLDGIAIALKHLEALTIAYVLDLNYPII